MPHQRFYYGHVYVWLHMLSIPLSPHPYTLSEGNGKLNIMLFRSHMSEFYRMEKKTPPTARSAWVKECFTLWWLKFLNCLCASECGLSAASVSSFSFCFFFCFSRLRSEAPQKRHWSMGQGCGHALQATLLKKKLLILLSFIIFLRRALNISLI